MYKIYRLGVYGTKKKKWYTKLFLIHYNVSSSVLWENTNIPLMSQSQKIAQIYHLHILSFKNPSYHHIFKCFCVRFLETRMSITQQEVGEQKLDVLTNLLLEKQFLFIKNDHFFADCIGCTVFKVEIWIFNVRLKNKTFKTLEQK